jgi:hypothetical protein
MNDRKKDKDTIKNLEDYYRCYPVGHSFNYMCHLSELQVIRVKNKLHIYDIPQKEENKQLSVAFDLNEVDKLLDLAYSWT